jgi:DNA repair protein RecO (recombination protein O)
MQTERAEAILLRRQPVTETSLLVTWFAHSAGKLKTMAKGARRPKSPFRGKLDLFYHDEIVWLPSRRGDLHLLHECFLINPHRPLRESLATLTAASYAVELVDTATEPEDPNPQLFGLLDSTLDALERRCSPVALLWFEMQLLALTGWTPRLESRGGVNRLLKSLAAATLPGALRVKLTDAQLREARAALWSFWDAHIGKPPRSRPVIAAWR